MSLNGKIADIEKTTRRTFTDAMSIGDKKSAVPETILANTQNIQKNVSGTMYTPKNIVGKAKGSLRRVVNTVTEMKRGISDTKRALDVYDMLGISKPGVESGVDGKIASYKAEPTEYDYNEGKTNGLQAFYKQFGDSSRAVETVDPFQTFECEFRFYPNIIDVRHVTKMNGFETEGDHEKNTSKIPSVIGQLFQDIQFRSLEGRGKVEKETLIGSKTEDWGDEWKDEYEYFKRETLSDLTVNLGIYIQKFNLPNVLVDGGEDVTTLVGKFPVPGNLVQPSDNSFSLEMVNTESPVIENVFYPWMRETTLPWWSYDSQPFTTATITLDFTEHADVKYHFFGCRPTQIMLIQPDQAPSQSMTRNVQFTFDFMTIESGKLKEMMV